MSEKVPKILMIVEGAKTDVKLMTHLLDMYGISRNHEIVSYNTNIYTLYREMFADEEPSRTPYEQSNSAINRRFCYNESKSYSSIWRVALFL